MRVFRRSLVAVLGLSVAAVVFFSGQVAAAWGRFTSPRHFAEGSTAFRFLTWRRGLDEADVHFVIWFLAAAVLMAGLTSRRGKAFVGSGLVLIGAGVELLQPALTTTRNCEWGDLIGGVLGTLVAVAVVEVISRTRARPPRATRSAAVAAAHVG